MQRVVGVRFKKAGKIYFFDPDQWELSLGDFVIVETARGLEYGEVVVEKREVTEEEIVSPLKKVIRKATEEDKAKEEENRKKEASAFDICLQKIADHGLPMKLIDVEYTFDNNKVIFYFTADGRVDFRELVKDLAAVFRTRIELRQIGVRDEAKMVGGMGPCGRELCCHSFLGEFAPVSIKMAKEQNLSLNPTKISGICGRLMCCLKYENDVYQEIKAGLPRINSIIETEKGDGRVVDIHVPRNLIHVEMLDDHRIVPYTIEQAKKFPRKYEVKEESDDELDELDVLPDDDNF
jgi:cell fate regulator YaaT (PSP1 superfamily)